MRLPAIAGVIDRRILANFRIDPEYMSAKLPAPFRPQVFNGWSIGGICLIRLKKIRPKFLPLPWGIGSENAAHRIAVEWDDQGKTNQGVYIPRRDTSSRLNAWAGGRIFPGVHHLAEFSVSETDDRLSVSMNSKDGRANIHVSGQVVDSIPGTSIFESTETASAFFEQGSLGYSDSSLGNTFDGLELRCTNWHVESLDVDSVQSSYFEDKSVFPSGSVEFDCALLMRNIFHEWHSRENLCCPSEPPKGTLPG